MGGFVSRPSPEKVMEYLKATPFFIIFDESELYECAEFFTVKDVDAGTQIEEADFIIVVKGQLSISTIVPKELTDEKNLSNKSELTASAKSRSPNVTEKLCIKKQGDFFSKASSELFAAENQKIVEKFDFTTVRAIEKSKLLILKKKDRKKFDSVYEEKGSLLQKVLSVDFKNLLRPIPFLSGVSPDKIGLLAEMFAFESFDANSAIVSEGEESDKFYIILSGTAAVYASADRAVDFTDRRRSEMPTPESTEAWPENSKLSIVMVKQCPMVELAQISEGAFFGEMALMCNIPRYATVVATSKCLLAGIGLSQFRAFEKVTPGVRSDLDTHAKERLMNRLIAFKIPFFINIPYPRLMELSKSCDLMQFNPGEIIIEQGEMSRFFYIVVHGYVQVAEAPYAVRADTDLDEPEQGSSEKRISLVPSLIMSKKTQIGKAKSSMRSTTGPKEFTTGFYFGEVSLLLNTPNSSTITSKGKVVLLAISIPAFKKFFSTSPEVWSEFEMRVLGKKHMRLRQILSHKRSLQLFRQHVESEFTVENLNFLEAVKSYRRLVSKDKGSSAENDRDAEIIAQGHKIVVEYLYESSPQQVNVPYSQRVELLTTLELPLDTLPPIESLKLEKLTKNVFDVCYNEIYRLLERDSFSRFKGTEVFDELLEELQVYTDDHLNLSGEEDKRRSMMRAIADEYSGRDPRRTSIFQQMEGIGALASSKMLEVTPENAKVN